MNDYNELKHLSRDIRHNILRAILKSKASHIASAMSIVDILATLYGDKYIDPSKAQFFLSKGHAGIAVYATLRVLNIIDEKMFSTYYENGSHLGGHVSHKGVNGVYLSTGSLGGGISVANGVALSNKINKIHNNKVYVIVGDGECGEGSIWEGALFAGHHKLKDVTVVVDRNRLQGCGSDREIMDLGDLAKKFSEFGWHCINIDGHDYKQLKQAFDYEVDKPKCIIANTTKGKGIKFMENNNLWHYRNVTVEDYAVALKDIGVK
ncbi:MAG: transketolase [Burkholderiales bacterium]|nr:transketolase [Burkholderiales bacterium]